MRDSFGSTAANTIDSYSLYRGKFRLATAADIEIRVVGSAWYQGWLDGGWLLEGPFRYELDHPEYQVEVQALEEGEHILAFHAHHIGADTRILQNTPPFLWCQVLADGAPCPIEWVCQSLPSQKSGLHRVNPQLGWIEWRDTRLEPDGWQKAEFDDCLWSPVVWGVSSLPEPTAAELGPVRTFFHSLVPEAEGPLTTIFGYAADEPAFVFYSRDRRCLDLPAKGIWRRYDLGRVRLGRPRFVLDLPEGAIVEFALSETLTEGRVSPFINLSAGSSCNLDHYIARGGEQEFVPLTPKGGRFLELHVVNAREGVRFLAEEFLERCYHAPTEAALACGDSLLEKIWAAGIETYRACAEDALTDNPTRERGQWVGDVASVGSAIASVAYHDLRLCRRALVQAALCAREDGLVAGLMPGGRIYMSTYAFQWTVAAVNYFRLTGERALLEELWAAGLRNMAAVREFWTSDGLDNNAVGWSFVDWGYQVEEGADLACNLHYLWSLRAMGCWSRTLGRDPLKFQAHENDLTHILRRRIEERVEAGGLAALGYHCTALALRMGLAPDTPKWLDFLEAHLLSCFPNDPEAPRNDAPDGFNRRLITPYFAHYVMPLLIERGRMDFVLEQYRKCWGEYMLADGRTTCLEVFDSRWSHCHQWSACPTWQMSRYLLGLNPRLDRGKAQFDFQLEPGSLAQASGRLPHPDGGWINVEWKRDDAVVHWSVRAARSLTVRFPDGTERVIRSEAVITYPIRQPGNSERQIDQMDLISL